MKKIFALALALMLVMSLGATAFAAEGKYTALDSDVTSTTFDVMGKSTMDSTTVTVISVDVSYGEMKFVYTTDTSKGQWDPTTHSYGTGADQSGGKWLVENNSNTITVTNHSNCEIKATLDATMETSYNTITPSFDRSELIIATAEDTAVTEAPNATAALNLANGSLTSDNYIKIGSVTVSIEENTANP